MNLCEWQFVVLGSHVVVHNLTAGVKVNMFTQGPHHFKEKNVFLLVILVLLCFLLTDTYPLAIVI